MGPHLHGHDWSGELSRASLARARQSHSGLAPPRAQARTLRRRRCAIAILTKTPSRASDGFIGRNTIPRTTIPASARIRLAIATPVRSRRRESAAIEPRRESPNPATIASGGSAGKMYVPSLERGIEKKTKITTNQMPRKVAAERCCSGLLSERTPPARIADHPSGTKKIHGQVPPTIIGMKNHGPHPCSFELT